MRVPGDLHLEASFVTRAHVALQSRARNCLRASRARIACLQSCAHNVDE